MFFSPRCRQITCDNENKGERPYGKGGIGKSTTVTNVAAAMAEKGLKIAVVGCDPKADTTRCLTGRRIPTVLSRLKVQTQSEIAVHGYRNILCIESGGPEPGTGCAGRGIASALQELREQNLFEKMDVVIYDVLGDVVCGGFSMPLREGVADDVYLVTTADYMAIYAANNICKGIAHYAKNNGIRLSGVIYNERSGIRSAEAVKHFAEAIGTELTDSIPLSKQISLAELESKTVIERFPQSDAAEHFRSLADKMLAGGLRCIPTPLEENALENLCRQTMCNSAE